MPITTAIAHPRQFPMLLDTPNRMAVWLMLGGLLGLLLALPALQLNMTDDTYIHARIAQHAAEHGFPAFNPGDTAKIDSSTGYALLLASLASLVDPVSAVRYLEFLSILFTTIALFYLTAISGRVVPTHLFVALSILPYFLLAAYGGMETPLVCLLLTLAASAHYHGKHGLVVLLIALCTWLRFEAILLLLLVGFYYFHVNKQRIALLFAFPFVLLAATDLMLYGTLLPHAAKAKAVGYDLPITESIHQALSFNKGTLGIAFGLLLLAVFAATGIRVLLDRLKLQLHEVFILFSAGVLAAWVVGGSLIFPWYYALLVFPFGIGVIASGWSGPARSASAARVMLAAQLVIVSVFGLLGAQTLKHESCGDWSSNLRVVRYLQIGSGLHGLCPSCSLVTSEIGGLGYGFKGRVYDAFGLGDPEAARFHPMKVPEERLSHRIGAIPPDYVAYRDPDFIVSMPVFSEALRGSSVIAAYNRYDCPIEDSGKIRIYQDAVVQIFSKTAIPQEVLSEMKCRVRT